MNTTTTCKSKKQDVFTDIIEIPLIPKDFKNTSSTNPHDCALNRAIKRKFKINSIDSSLYVDCTVVAIINVYYKIKGGFYCYDYDFVKEQYEKDPEMKDTQYIVTLIKLK